MMLVDKHQLLRYLALSIHSTVVFHLFIQAESIFLFINKKKHVHVEFPHKTVVVVMTSQLTFSFKPSFSFFVVYLSNKE